jgi:hypothetical protein
VALGACAAVAIATLPLPAAMAYDPTAWLVWGRELLHGELDTTGGPSWKPLPVVVTTVLAPLGDLADDVWLVVARTSALFALVLAYRLASRYAGPVAGAVAAAALVLTPDGGPRLLRLFAEGHAEPMGVTLCLWAIERHLDGRRDHAVLLGVAFALLRPECWPFLAVYAGWLWLRDPALRRLLVVVLPIIPLLWFGGDWLGSGSPVHGAAGAQVSAGDGGRAALALERAWEVVIVPVWAAAAFGAVTAWRRRERELLVIGAGALAWSAIVVAMSIGLGYAALSRFYLPAAAVLCVLAGIGAARLVDGRPVVAVAALVVTLPFAAPRLAAFPSLVDEFRVRHDLDRGLDVVLDRIDDSDVLRACGRIAIEPSELPTVALAHKLDVALADARTSLARQPGVYFALVGGRQDTRLGRRDDARPLARSAQWAAYAVQCE